MDTQYFWKKCEYGVLKGSKQWTHGQLKFKLVGIHHAFKEGKIAKTH
jgi:hypothetical protein